MSASVRGPHPSGRQGPAVARAARAVLLGVALAALGGCAVAPRPLTAEETEARIDRDLTALFAAQAPIAGPVAMEEAMARAILYNLDNRVRVMEQALAQRQLDLSRWDMLPQVLASAGIESRSNTSASSSEDVETGEESLTTSTSLDDDRLVADLTFVFNVLDFGVSYFNARQQADRTLIARERQRRVVHGIIQDVRSAYWRAVAAERLIDRIDPLLERVEAARADAQTIQRLRLRSPLEALDYQRTVLDTLSRLQDLRSRLALAKTELAALMNMPLDANFSLAVPDPEGQALADMTLEPAALERVALAYRPELREESYQARISADETRKAIVRLLPGLEIETGPQYDSNSFLLNNAWYEVGLRVTWNLMSVVTGPSRIGFAEAQEEVVEARRQALSMAVLTQLHVAWHSYREAADRYETAAELYAVESEILDQLRRRREAGRTGDLEVIGAELDALVAALRRDLAYADARNAAGRVFLAVGADPLPATIEAANVPALTEAIGRTLDGWYRGELNLGPEAAVIAGAAMANGAAPAATSRPVAAGPAGAGPAGPTPSRPSSGTITTASGASVRLASTAADRPDGVRTAVPAAE